MPRKLCLEHLEKYLYLKKKEMTRISSYLLLTILALSTPSWAQKASSKLKGRASTEQISQFYYTFTQLTASYVPLVNPISLTAGVTWDDPSLPISTTFPVVINGVTLDIVGIEGLGATIVGGALSNPNTIYLAAPFEADVIDRGYDSSISLSPISYKIEGPTGSRILKIEWKEVGSYGEYDLTGGILTNFISFQAWIYEGTNVIEYRYGANTITNSPLFYDGETGPYIGFATETGANLTSNLLSGPVANPTLVLTEQAVIGTPANGTVYRFTPVGGTGSSVAEQHLRQTLTVFPNPASDILQLQLKNQVAEAQVQLYDLSGREVKRIQLTEMQTTLDISDLAAGMYNLRIEGVAGSLKIIKK